MSASVEQRRLRARSAECAYCRQSVPASERTVDHEPPRAAVRAILRAGGDDAAPTYRLIPCCRPCNELKGARTEGQFRAWLDTPSGERWLRLRAGEIATGTVSPDRADIMRDAARTA